jgi:hypothetical protein
MDDLHAGVAFDGLGPLEHIHGEEWAYILRFAGNGGVG